MESNQWNPAKVWKGCESQICAQCRSRILRGEMSKQNNATGRIYHDDCAEDIGAYHGTYDEWKEVAGGR